METLIYDSDHLAICTEIFQIENEFNIAITENKNFLYTKTNWNKFRKYIKTKLQLDETLINLPNNRNLTITEINSSLKQIENIILEAMQYTNPRHDNNKNSIDIYVNKRINTFKKV